MSKIETPPVPMSVSPVPNKDCVHRHPASRQEDLPVSIRISGVGCSLMDYLYTGIDFGSAAFKSFQSKQPGDGGLTPGKLVFAADLEEFAGRPTPEIIAAVTGGKAPDATNIGGPSIVALINIAQLAADDAIAIAFYGATGEDDAAEQIREILKETAVDTSGYVSVPGTTPWTVVFSDPDYDNGHGERAFVNNLGAADRYLPADLPDRFFEGDILIYGGTAIQPQIHTGLTGLLRRGSEAGKINVVNTVYDFLNERKDPQGRWPLGESVESYRYIDLLIVDREEALRLSGTESVDGSLDFFREKGVSAVLITQGAQPVRAYSDGSLFRAASLDGANSPDGTYGEFPVSRRVRQELAAGAGRLGDTTGCGDNFVGGVVYSLATQLARNGDTGAIDLAEACAWGMCCGGFSCYYMGGYYRETAAGEKKKRIGPYVDAYREQIAGY
jgi:sugar/nucleoside kinase (ribokinase family)